MVAHKLYAVKIKYDTGFITLRLFARTKEQAILNVMAVESCPRRAIVSVEVVS